MTDSNNNVLYRIAYDQAGQPQFITIYVNGNPLTYAYVYDGLGNVQGLVHLNSSDTTYGQEVVTYAYNEWGQVSVGDNSGNGLGTTNPFLYQGYWYHWATGLYYLNARYYNPAWGRFISEDPAGVNPVDVTSYNAYEYAANNPLTISDPSGEMHQEGGSDLHCDPYQPGSACYNGINDSVTPVPIYEDPIAQRIMILSGVRALADAAGDTAVDVAESSLLKVIGRLPDTSKVSRPGRI